MFLEYCCYVLLTSTQSDNDSSTVDDLKQLVIRQLILKSLQQGGKPKAGGFCVRDSYNK
jgi:hypothetical protein